MLEADTPPLLLADLPADLVQHIVVRLTLAHDIARTAPTCKVASVAAREAFMVRPFSGEVVTLADAHCVATAPDGDAFCVADRDRPNAARRRVRANHPGASIEWLQEVAALPERPSNETRRDGTANAVGLDGARAHLHRGHVMWSRRCPTVTLWLAAAAASATQARSGCTTSTGRSSTPSRGTCRRWCASKTSRWR